jgi:hypothetical protein
LLGDIKLVDPNLLFFYLKLFFLKKKKMLLKKKKQKKKIILPKYLSKFIRKFEGLKLKRKLINYKNHHHTIHIEVE